MLENSWSYCVVAVVAVVAVVFVVFGVSFFIRAHAAIIMPISPMIPTKA